MKRKIVYSVLLLLGFLAFVVLTHLFIANYGRLRYSGELHPPIPVSRWIRIQSNHATSSVEVGSITGWMTFDYINRVFNLPADYLKTKLAVMDPRYPKLTISKAAVSQQVSEEVYLGDLKNAISWYLASSTQK